jgi:hypothetical protein
VAFAGGSLSGTLESGVKGKREGTVGTKFPTKEKGLLFHRIRLL